MISARSMILPSSCSALSLALRCWKVSGVSILRSFFNDLPSYMIAHLRRKGIQAYDHVGSAQIGKLSVICILQLILSSVTIPESDTRRRAIYPVVVLQAGEAS